MLHYEKLDVYQVSIQFVAAAVAISEQVPKGYAALADQLRRAAWSIPLNIAERVGKPSAAEQARFHAIARGRTLTLTLTTTSQDCCRELLTLMGDTPYSVRRVVGAGDAVLLELAQQVAAADAE